MRKQDQLVKLIASLSPNERRYFKLLSNTQPGDKRYLQLFDTLENETTYDAAALSKALNIAPTQLADEKFYLTQVLLRTLRNYDDDATPLNSVASIYLEANALFARRFYQYAFDHNEKALTKAIELEVYNLLPAIISLKQSCLRTLGRFEEHKQLLRIKLSLQKKENELFELMRLSFQITNFEQRREHTDEVKKLSLHPLLKKKPDTVRGYIVFLNIIGSLNHLQPSAKSTWLKTLKEGVRFLEKHAHSLEINPLGYLYLYTDLASASLMSDDVTGCLQAIEKLLVLVDRPIPAAPKPEIQSLKIFAQYLKSFTLRTIRKYKEAVPHATSAYNNRNLRSEYDQFGFAFEYALVMLHTGQVDEANTTVNELLQMNTDVRIDLQRTLRPLQMMIQVLLGNDQLIPYLVRSAKAWTKRQKINDPELDIFYTHIQTIAKPDKKDKQQGMEALQQVISKGKIHETDHTLHIGEWLKTYADKLAAK